MTPADSAATEPYPDYETWPAWRKTLHAIVLAGETGCPPMALAMVARNALEDEGVPMKEAESNG